MCLQQPVAPDLRFHQIFVAFIEKPIGITDQHEPGLCAARLLIDHPHTIEVAFAYPNGQIFCKKQKKQKTP